MAHKETSLAGSSECPSQDQARPETKSPSNLSSRRSFLKAGAVSLLGAAAVMTQLNDARSNAKAGGLASSMSTQDKAGMIAKIDQLYPLEGDVVASTQSPQERLARLQREAESGNATAQYMLATAYMTGQAFTLEMTELDKPLERHAEKFGIPDRSSLGLANFTSSAEWYQKAALKGHGDALFTLCMLSANCNDVDRNLVTAAEWMQKAAVQGHGDAQYKLGMMYARGDGVSEDIATTENFDKLARPSLA